MKREQNGNKPRSTANKTRLCLSCRASFPSEGPHHRICDTCKGLRAWGGDNPLYECHVPAKAANDNSG